MVADAVAVAVACAKDDDTAKIVIANAAPAAVNNFFMILF